MESLEDKLTHTEIKPWTKRADEIYSTINLQKGKKLVSWLAKKEYSFENSPNKRTRFGYNFARYVVATWAQGSRSKKYNKILSSITKVKPKTAQDLNAALGIGLMVSSYIGVDIGAHALHADFLSYIAAAGNSAIAGWNIYRLANRDEHARMALGYEPIITNTALYLKDNKTSINTIFQEKIHESRKLII